MPSRRKGKNFKGQQVAKFDPSKEVVKKSIPRKLESSGCIATCLGASISSGHNALSCECVCHTTFKIGRNMPPMGHREDLKLV